MFEEQKGKCDYCGRDMILSWDGKVVPPDLATFDHKYNRDHPNRHLPPAPGEKRIFLVCYKCNQDKSKEEPNSNEKQSADKLLNKLVLANPHLTPTQQEKLHQSILMETYLNRRLNELSQVLKITHEKKEKITEQISILAKYRYTILNLKDG